MRQREVAVMPLAQWQVFYFRENAWSNPLSTPGTTAEAPNPNPGASPNPAPAAGSVLPDGVRLVLDLPPGRALAGQLSRDWVRPTLTP
jgi:general secretion pathway protein J